MERFIHAVSVLWSAIDIFFGWINKLSLSVGAHARTHTLTNAHTNTRTQTHTHTHTHVHTHTHTHTHTHAHTHTHTHTHNRPQSSLFCLCFCLSACLLPPISPFSLYTFAPFLGADVSTCPTPSPYIPSLAPSNAFLTFHPLHPSRSLLCHFAFCVRCFHEEKECSSR